MKSHYLTLNQAYWDKQAAMENQWSKPVDDKEIIQSTVKPRPSGRGYKARFFNSLGVSCCSMYWRIMDIGAPPQLPAK